jgi:L-lactate dehydrogenase complex protein LldF
LHEKFMADTVRAVHNPQLTQAMDRATRRQDDARKIIIQELGDPLAVRELAGECRDRALDRLDERLARLAEGVQRNGGQVHWALDGETACHIVQRIARRARCKLIIKTKSMMCEEIELNPFLQRSGLEVVETDLGEYIVQLAGEPPSHIVGPACHKSAGEVAELFNEKLGVPYTEDPEILARSAREVLREKFRQADMGITGANFAIARTGTVVTVTNEGNGRFVASRPRVLVTVMGMEKVIGSTADLAVLLKVLPRSATGQRLSVYTNLTDGPRRPGDADGPEEYHLIVVDNGRSRILASRYRQLLRCVRCGACLNACPVYRKIGGHAYGSVYPGPIGKLLTPLLETLIARADFPQASALCDACRDACPVRIDLPEMLIMMRNDLRRMNQIPLTYRLGFAVWAKVMKSPRLYRLANRLGRFGLLMEAFQGWVDRIPPAGNPWTDVRDLPVPAARPFNRIWQGSLKHVRSWAPPPVTRAPAMTVQPYGSAPGGHADRRPYREPASADPWAAASQSAQGKGEVTQEEFLRRVRQALSGVACGPVDPDTERARLVGRDGDLVALFKQRAAELHVNLHEADDPGQAIDVVGNIIRDMGASRAVMADEGLLHAASMVARLLSFSCSLTVVREGTGPDASFDADVGITSAELGIAETGSVVLQSGGPRRRLVGLAPPAHIIVLPKARIVADLLDWARWCDAQPPQANRTIITGPSKTADIELTLVTGMHAPGVVHVVLVG